MEPLILILVAAFIVFDFDPWEKSSTPQNGASLFEGGLVGSLIRELDTIWEKLGW